jgi:hypothetical protein
MNEYSTFSVGVNDAKNDLAEGWVPESVSIDSIANQLRVMVGASDAYIAGYSSVVFAEKPTTALEIMQLASVLIGESASLVWSVGNRELSEKLSDLNEYLESEIECEITGVEPDYDD